VRLGEFDLSKDPDGTRENPAEPVRKEEAEEVIIHPNFSRSTLSHDIALIRLKTRIRQYSSKATAREGDTDLRYFNF